MVPHTGFVTVPVAAVLAVVSWGPLVVSTTNPLALAGSLLTAAAFGWGLRPGGWVRRVAVWVWDVVHREGREEFAAAIMATDTASDRVRGLVAEEVAPLLVEFDARHNLLVDTAAQINDALRLLESQLGGLRAASDVGFGELRNRLVDHEAAECTRWDDIADRLGRLEQRDEARRRVDGTETG